MLYYRFDFEKLVQILIIGWLVFRLLRAFLRGKPNLVRAALISALFLFVIFLLYRTFEPFEFTSGWSSPKANLKPVQGILSMIENASKFDDDLTRRIVFINIVGNILIFSPFGLFFPMLEKKLRHFWLVVLTGFAISLAIELTQTLLAARVFDVDDLILNSFGTWIGYLLFWLAYQIKPMREAFDRLAEASRPKAGLFVAVYLLFAAAAAYMLFYQGYMAFKQIPQ